MSNPNLKPQKQNLNLPEKSAAPPPANNARATKLEIQKRIEYSVELILNDMSSYDVARVLMAKYGLSYRQALRYYYIAFAALEQKSEITIKRKKSWYVARKLRLIRDMDPKEKRTAAGVLAVNKVLDSLAAMDGIQTSLPNKLIVKGDPENPIRTENTHTVTHRNEVDYSNLATEDLEAMISMHSKTNFVQDIDHEEVKQNK